MSKVDLKVPVIAWPTLALTALVLVVWTGSAAGHALGLLPWWATLTLSTWAAFAAFTPLHDATHRAVGKDPRLNALAGWLCTPPLMAPYSAFRLFHLTHHRHTNEPEHDPDMWSGTGPRVLLPLRWLTQDLHYIVRYLGMRDRPVREQVETWGLFLGMYGLAAWGLTTEHGATVLFAWLLPARLGIGLLAFSFDFLPHWPHAIPGRVDRHRATVILEEPWLSLPMLSQNYHLVHHLYPAVPFYRYGKVWRAKREELLAKGAVEVSIFGARPELQPSASAADTAACRAAAS